MTVRILILALVAIAGLFGLLVSSGVWDMVYFLLAALPILLAGGFIVFRKAQQ